MPLAEQAVAKTVTVTPTAHGRSLPEVTLANISSPTVQTAIQTIHHATILARHVKIATYIQIGAIQAPSVIQGFRPGAPHATPTISPGSSAKTAIRSALAGAIAIQGSTPGLAQRATRMEPATMTMAVKVDTGKMIMAEVMTMIDIMATD